MRILFITHPYPNYVPDLLLHGLRKLMGPQVVDYPKKDCVYNGVLGLGVCPDDQRCPGWFPPDNGQIDREEIPRKAASGYFNYIICDVRALGYLQEHFTAWSSGLIIIDGEDLPVKIPPGKYIICRRETDGSDFSIPLPMAIPEEILNWITSYDDEPKQYSIGFLGGTHDGLRKSIAEILAQFYPDALLQTSVVPTDSDPAPAGRLGRDEYYRSLQKSCLVLSLPGAGYDTFRYWENAACNAVHVSARMPLLIPNDFTEPCHILRFASNDELRKIVDRVLEGRLNTKEIILESRNHLVNYHLTTKRAEYFLERVNYTFAN
ncbi:MAG: glycosyltransferase family 1 protein [Desulfobacterales bacterium]|nr:MAG: glycosyltransferase family 1 protein [Desulfobacterales bacterium]